jgi:very-short-patch-repair endonuclease
MTDPLRGEVLVAIMNNKSDFKIAREEGWYRIPVASAKRFLKSRWPPQWLAFYQTKTFGKEAYAVRYYARVSRIYEVSRQQLFPDESPNPKAHKRYYKLEFSELRTLPTPILSRRYRRIVFIPTTWDKLIHALEINDLYDESPLEDRLWALFRRYKIDSERQFYVQLQRRFYALDFAVFCADGQIDIEADGDTWHADPDRIPEDNQRDNNLTRAGWHILRFNGSQIREAGMDYCIPNVMATINTLGGMNTGKFVARRFNAEDPEGYQQMVLFESPPTYRVD